MSEAELDYMQEIKATFIEESRDSLERVETLALDLQVGRASVEMLNAIYRAVHSIKGNSGYFNFDGVTRVSHQFETLLTQLTRDGRVFTEEIKGFLISGIDILKNKFSRLTACTQCDLTTEQDLTFIVKISQICETPIVALKSNDLANNPDAPNIHAYRDDFSSKTIRINQDRLDSFMYYIGEILMQKETFSYLHEKIERKLPNSEESKELKTVLDVLEKNIISLQHSVLSIRKIPICQLFNRYKRLIHDLANTLNKKIELIIEGDCLELDKNLIDQIEAPLTHMVRNCADHGIEKPEERLANNKTEAGKIILKAYLQDQFTVIEVSDNGKGINLEKVKQKAIEKGICTLEEFTNMPKEKQLALIFHAGFSTKEEVSTISGRGVGMDVVKTAIDKLNGKIEMESEFNQGTRISLLLPNSSILMTKRTLICQVEKQIFAIPIENVVELQRVVTDAIVHSSQSEQLYKYQNKMIPLISLQRHLNISTHTQTQSQANIVIILTDNKNNEVGCVVQEVLDRKNLVIRKFEINNNSEVNTNYFLGSAILGNGQVILVLNPESLIEV